MSNRTMSRHTRYLMILGRMIGTFVFLTDAPHRRIVRRNLRFTHPHWSPEQIHRISKRVFQNLGITFLEICKLVSDTRDDVLAKAQILGLEHLTQALDKNKGLIIVSAHIGNWELGLQYAACYLQQPIVGVAKKIRLQPLNRWVHRLRTRFGNKIIYKKGALPEMRQVLRRGGIVVLLVDQSRRSEGVDVTFLGRKVTATPAAAFLAIRCHSPVLPIFCVRESNGQLAIHINSPLNFERTGDLHADIQSSTQIITDEVERAVRKYPDQWLWLHKRWKKYYPDLYPEYQARRLRRKQRKQRRN